ncbi:MlaD family protein [Alloprevotella sp. Lung230]|uniref:MlaD family protein n=1 Tax=Alloprevotella sp. Lung230 TaxID=2766595 RepID=UPI0016566BC1|nr:MlaD family protein [Alloprevotella sp. Lung230]MBC8625839.1 MCE family protein [Alloprevotella sp. Lung230]
MKLTNEVKIALTAIAAVALLFVGINFLKGINVFESSNSYYVKFKDIKGLAVSNLVYANGYPVGTVRDIDYNYGDNNGVVVRVELDENMRIPRNTHAELEVALMGGVTMNLVLGPNPTDNIAPHDTIDGGLYSGAMDKASALIPDVARMLPKLDSILTNLNRLSGDPALQKTLANAAEISENLKTTSAQLDRMMGREVPQMMGHLNRTAAHAEAFSGQLAQVNVKQTMAEVQGTLQSVNTMAGQMNSLLTDVNQKLNSPTNNLGAFLADRKLYDRLNSTVSHADSLMIDLKAHPKRYVHFSLFGRKSK